MQSVGLPCATMIDSLIPRSLIGSNWNHLQTTPSLRSVALLVDYHIRSLILQYIMYIILGGAIVADSTVAFSLCYYLAQNRTGLRRHVYYINGIYEDLQLILSQHRYNYKHPDCIRDWVGTGYLVRSGSLPTICIISKSSPAVSVLHLQCLSYVFLWSCHLNTCINTVLISTPRCQPISSIWHSTSSWVKVWVTYTYCIAYRYQHHSQCITMFSWPTWMRGTLYARRLGALTT